MNTIFKITSKKRDGGRDILSYLDERTKNNVIKFEELYIQPTGNLSPYPVKHAETLFLNKAEKLNRPQRPKFIRSVVSFSNQYELQLRQKKLNPTKCLNYIVDSVLSEYSTKICGRPDGLFSFRGTHRATDNLHTHIAFLTETANNKYTPISTSKLYQKDEKYPDYFAFFRQKAEEISNQILKKPPLFLFDKEQILNEAKKKQTQTNIEKFKNNNLKLLLEYKKLLNKTKKDNKDTELSFPETGYTTPKENISGGIKISTTQ